MKQIYITRQSLRQIDKISWTSKTETGGVLVGTRNQAAILFAGDPGPKAKLNHASYSSDPDHDQKLLEDAQKRYDGRVTLLGYWHKHPPGVNEPSGGDLSQAQELMATQSDKVLPWLLVFIIDPVHPRGRNIFPYVLRLHENRFHLLQLNAVEEEDVIVQQVLQAEPLHALSQENDNFWRNPGFRFQLTPTGAQRLQEEKKQMETAGYQVQVRQRKDCRRVALIVNRGDGSWLCVPPREYPLNMPRLFQLPDLEEVFPFREHLVWNSDLTLMDCLAALKPPPVTDNPESETEAESELRLVHKPLLGPVEVPPMPLVLVGPPRRAPISLAWIPLVVVLLVGGLLVARMRR